MGLFDRITRAWKLRADADILVEGYGPDYGWVSNYAAVGGTVGDYEPDGCRPSWWVGWEGPDGQPIGPHGPGPVDGYTYPGSFGSGSPWSGEGYGWDTRGGQQSFSWWNNGQRPVEILPAVTRCTEVIVNPVVRTPWLLERGPDVLPLPLWVRDPMLLGRSTGDVWPELPAAHRLPAQAFWATWLTHALWWGRGVMVFRPNADGEPVPGSCRLLNPFMVGSDWAGRWVIDPEGETPLVTDEDGGFTIGGVGYRMLVLRGLPPNNGTTPEGVLQRHFGLLRLGAHIHAYSDGTFKSGVPSGYLKVSAPNMTQDDANRLKDRWMAAHSGDRRSVAVLNAVTDYTPISLNPVDADTDKLKQALLVDVAHAFGLSASFLDSGSASNTYANLTDKNRELVDLTLSAWGQQMTETLSAVLPLGTTLRVDWTNFTRPDMPTQLPVVMSAWQAGFMSLDEARRRAGLPKADPGEQWAAESPGGVSPVEAIQKVYLGVGTVLTADEARQMVNDQTGTSLPVPGPFADTNVSSTQQTAVRDEEADDAEV